MKGYNTRSVWIISAEIRYLLSEQKKFQNKSKNIDEVYQMCIRDRCEGGRDPWRIPEDRKPARRGDNGKSHLLIYKLFTF